MADAARNKEWRNKEYCEVNNEQDDYVATGRALSFVEQTTLKLIRTIKYRDVAQFGRALRSGRRGCGFKSRHLDQKRLKINDF